MGSALIRALRANKYTNIVTRSHAELELTDPVPVRAFFETEKPEYVFLAAAKVGGIQANFNYPAEFIQINLSIQNSVIHAAYLSGVKRLMFFGSNCTYPKDCSQPMGENQLFSGSLESTSEPYAIAKIAGMKMCDAYNRQYGTSFLSVIPATLYGPHDNFDSETAHVLSALLTRFHIARESGQQEVAVWGSGIPRREFLYVDDLADACLLLMNIEESELKRAIGEIGWVINVGFGEDLSIKELASKIKRAVGYPGKIRTDPSRLDGVAQKLLDSRRVRNLGWLPKVMLEDGIGETYAWVRDTVFNEPQELGNPA